MSYGFAKQRRFPLARQGFSFLEIFVGLMIFITCAASLMMVSDTTRRHAHFKQRYYSRQVAELALGQAHALAREEKPLDMASQQPLLAMDQPDSWFSAVHNPAFPLENSSTLKRTLKPYELEARVEIDSSVTSTGQHVEITVYYPSPNRKTTLDSSQWFTFSGSARLPLK